MAGLLYLRSSVRPVHRTLLVLTVVVLLGPAEEVGSDRPVDDGGGVRGLLELPRFILLRLPVFLEVDLVLQYGR